MDGPSVTAFNAASTFFLRAVELVPNEKWQACGIGNWTVLELVGHTNRAFTTIEEYLLRPVAPEPKQSDYFSDASIAARGRKSVEDLGDDPKQAVATTAQRTGQLVKNTPADASLGSPVRTMSLGDYLPSRTAELTIHGLDLIDALGVELSPPLQAVEESLVFVARLTAKKGDGEVVLRALTGRGELPGEFCVY